MKYTLVSALLILLFYVVYLRRRVKTLTTSETALKTAISDKEAQLTDLTDVFSIYEDKLLYLEEINDRYVYKKL